jgi:N-hydroxyarylamine O-acetyltransferase
VDVDRYLARIGYSGARDQSAEVLRGLHRRHLLTVPFENLDVARRRRIAIDEPALIRKVVDERRGGLCYELNGAFAALLRALGFEVALLSAGVARDAGGFGPDFDHLTLLAAVAGESWLADVGFGDSFVQPLRFEPGREQEDPAGLFRIASLGDGAFVLERHQDNLWTPQYRFTLTPHTLDEYTGMCHYHQTSPRSSFTQKSICSRATDTGRITLSGRCLITTSKGQRDEHELTSDQEWRAALREHFGIGLGEE